MMVSSGLPLGRASSEKGEKKENVVREYKHWGWTRRSVGDSSKKGHEQGPWASRGFQGYESSKEDQTGEGQSQ